MSDNDAQLELKKRARRRLVGAIALAVLAAVVLPMVMDPAPRQPPAEDLQIRIPAPDAGTFTSRILPVKPGSTPTPLPPPDAKPAAEAPATTEAKVEKTAPKPAAEAMAARPEARVVPPKAGQAGEKVSAAATAPAAGEQWVVQLGAYRDPANVRNLTAKIRQQGYNFYTEELPAADGTPRTRVRAGPFPSREAAEAARERIRRLGVEGTVAQKQ